MDKPQEKTTDTNEKPKGAFPAVPTTKILAIGRRGPCWGNFLWMTRSSWSSISSSLVR